jgi:hypothetical protein
MTLNAIFHAVISSSKWVISKTIQNPHSTIALPLSSMAVAYASSLPSKPLQDCYREQEPKKQRQAGKRLGNENRVEIKTKRCYHGSPALHSQLPIFVQTSPDRTIDPYLGNLLDGFCNGSCHETSMR